MQGLAPVMLVARIALFEAVARVSNPVAASTEKVQVTGHSSAPKSDIASSKLGPRLGYATICQHLLPGLLDRLGGCCICTCVPLIRNR
jgi:hypothetical protein